MIVHLLSLRTINCNLIKKVKEIIKIIENDGWYLSAHKGTSHRQFKHETKKRQSNHKR